MTLFTVLNNRLKLVLVGLIFATGWTTLTTEQPTCSSTLSASATPGSDQGTKGTGSAGRQLV